MKYLRVTMPDGSRWDVPAHIIAANRANYYFNVDDDQPKWTAEFKSALDDSKELTDWAANNMNWHGVANLAAKVSTQSPVEVDYQEGWINGPKQIVEHE